MVTHQPLVRRDKVEIEVREVLQQRGEASVSLLTKNTAIRDRLTNDGVERVGISATVILFQRGVTPLRLSISMC